MRSVFVRRHTVLAPVSAPGIAGVQAPRLCWYRYRSHHTDMMKGARMPLRKANVAARDLIGLIGALTLDTSGSYLNCDGKGVPW